MNKLCKITTLLITSAFLMLTKAWSDPQVPCLFIFGDSLVDNGNNNRILTLARANYPPYGIDFPQGSSGRFTNGQTTVDFLARLLGFRQLVPAYANARRTEVLRGFNFASGAAGIRAETGSNHFEEQVDHFEEALRFMIRMFRGNRTAGAEHLSKCIYYAGMGSNDYLNNYFMPTMYGTSSYYSPSTYAAILIDAYSRQLTRLYDLGARKVAIIGVGQIGCIPYQLARLNDNRNGNATRCNDRINKIINIFNMGLLKMVKQFNRELPGAKFVFVNTSESSRDVVRNAASYGFDVIDKGCCGVGRNNGQITCLPFQQPCQDRTKYLFWDAFHPTEVANYIYAKKAYSSQSTADVYPMNIKRLAMI